MAHFSRYSAFIFLCFSLFFLLHCSEKSGLSGKYENNGYVFQLNSDETMKWSYRDNGGEGRWFVNEATLYVVHNDGTKEEFWLEDDKITNKITGIIFSKNKK